VDNSADFSTDWSSYPQFKAGYPHFLKVYSRIAVHVTTVPERPLVPLAAEGAVGPRWLSLTETALCRWRSPPGQTQTAVELRQVHEATRLELQAINQRQFSSFCQ